MIRVSIPKRPGPFGLSPVMIMLAVLLTALNIGSPVSTAAAADWEKRVAALAGTGGVLVEDGQGGAILSINPDRPLAPASSLKVVTAAAALELLGPDYRFTTEFRLSAEGDLYVVGHGDPYLISEELAIIANELVGKGLKQVRDLKLDNRFFQQGLVLHGTGRSLNPYDAYNGALCVNFNTIFAYIGQDGTVTSAEPQTPITPLGKELALASKARGKVRINLAENPRTCLLYAGDLFRAFLEQAGVPVTGTIAPAEGDISGVPVFHTHSSRKNLESLIQELFKYSNNFMTNQVFLTMGAEKFGPPADPDKSRAVIADFQKAHQIPPFHMEEGSGLSRRTTLTPRQMLMVVKAFAPFRHLLVEDGQVLYKTGTLSDVKAVVGFLEPVSGPPKPFAVMLNGQGASARQRSQILDLLKKNLLN